MDTLPLFAFAAFAVLDWVAVAYRAKPLEYLAKPATLAALLIWAAGAGGPPVLVLALALSLLGDVYLMLPADLFAAGLGAFLLAHLGYIAAFDAAAWARVAWAAAILAATAPFSLRILRAIPAPPLRGTVCVYMAAIALMAGSALASRSAPATAGALLFVASDFLIAWNRFVRPVPWAQPAIHATYHLGQLGLVTALAGGR